MGQVLTWLLALSVSAPAFAKGLDDLSPEVPTSENAASEAKPSEPAAAPTEEKKDADTEAPEAAKETEEQKTAEPPKEPSATSKKLADKLQLTSGVHFVQLAGRKGSWNTSATGDVQVSYLLKKNPYPDGRLAKMDIHAVARYTPYDVVVESDKQSYRGVIEGFHFGVAMTRPYGDSFRAAGAAEIGYLITHLDPTDGFEKDKDLEKGGAAFTLSGGCDWIFNSKVTVGPRLGLGFGSLNSTQFGANLGFIF